VRYLMASAPGHVEVRDGRSPALARGQVRVKIAFAGVCHSDTALVSAGSGSFPYRLGHEVSGTVVESAADAMPAGARVVAYVEDGYATEVVTAAANLVALDPSCDLLDAALAEPVACVIGGMSMLDLARVDRVAVVGAGFMGLLTIGYLSALGHRVMAVEPRAKTRRLALEHGAEEAVEPAAVPHAWRAAFPLVVEATGAPAGLTLAGDLVGVAGTLGIMGYHQSEGGWRQVDMRSWNFRCLRVLNLQSRARPDGLRWIDRAQRMSARGVLRPGRLVDEQVSLDELAGLFHEEGRPDVVKSVLRVASA
jgi:threonine dehydrogenase-like Zn-dependent dehydrogenase